MDKNKTDDARIWALSEGAASALSRFRKDYRSDDGAEALVFRGLNGKPLKKPGIADRVRGHLKTAGIDRAELFVSTGERRKFRSRDLPGTFVTVSLATGRTEAWLADRTGHKSSQIINRYRRLARALKELGQGGSLPLDWAIPGLRDCPRNTQRLPEDLDGKRKAPVITEAFRG